MEIKTISPLTKDCSRITQGTIIRYVYCRNYAPLDSYGLIITARCDLANESKQVPYIYYVPIVPLQKYLDKELKWKLLDDVYDSKFSSLKAEFKNAKLSIDSALQIDPNEFIEKTLNVKAKNLKKPYQALIDLRNAIINKDVSNVTSYLASEFTKAMKSLLDNKEVAYHYLPWIDEKREFGEHFLCLFREINYFEPKYVLESLQGVSPKLLCPNIQDVDVSELSYAASEICSPEIEQIMQRFSNLFARIGVKNRVKIDDIIHNVELK